ncbi:MAG: hypothetical protein ACP5VR_04450 [Acidimicrobiales bacterium]
MFRRAKWLGIGLVVGAGASKWAERKVRNRIERYFPASRLGARVADRAREIASSKAQELREAVEVARTGMEEAEAELRARLAGRSGAPGQAVSLELVEARRAREAMEVAEGTASRGRRRRR